MLKGFNTVKLVFMSYQDIVRKFITEQKIKHIFASLLADKKTNNPFILATENKELIKYSTAVRSIESRIGNFIEKLAKEIVKGKFQTLSDIETEKVKGNPDLCFFKDEHWNIIELKAGGNIDSKKMKGERDYLKELKKEISKIKKTTRVRFFYAVAYRNIKNYEKLNFNKEDLLIEEDFWKFISDDSACQKFILDTFADTFKEVFK